MRLNDLLNKKLSYMLLLLFLGSFLFAGDNTIKVEQLYPGKVDVKYFRLDKTNEIKIIGKGAKLKKRTRNILCYGWILDAERNKVVWSSIKQNQHKYNDDSGIFSIDDNIQLPAGIYKLYYASVYDTDGINISDFNDLVETIFSKWDDEELFTFNEDELQMILKGQKGSFQEIEDYSYYMPKGEREVVSFLKTTDDSYNEKAFTLKKETELTIFSMGEKKDRKFYDYGRIYDMNNHEVLWPKKSTIYEYAGGGWKNVQAQEKMTFPAGTYSVTYVTDDSHAYNEWNVMPPNNPEGWGIHISCSDEDYKNIDFSVKKIEPVVDLTKVGNHEVLSKAIEITKDIDFRVICLGEYNDGEAYDYGWIENALSNEIVWKFNGSNTVHAGGGEKNRKFNGIINLKKGKYLIKYISDGSHSYYDWNTTAPFDKEYWGISLWTINKNDKKYIKEISEHQVESENLIVKIDRVGDHEKIHKDFVINTDALYRVLAIGEGDDGEMYDTGWIQNTNTGQVVWEMTWRNSQHAGGASKNRMFNGKVYLQKGNYRVFFETDGSHSFADWNSAPPHNPDKYGIRIMKDE